MKITIAKSAGFCFGVNRAINLLYDAMKTEQGKIFTLGPIIHNPQMISSLQKKGVSVTENPLSVNENDLLVIRTHGIPKEDFDAIKNNNSRYLDVTCPFVKKIHNIVESEHNNGRIILIAGDPNHPEVKGIVSYTDNAFVFKNLEELKKLLSENAEIQNKDCILAAQTTFSAKEWLNINEYLRKVCTNIKIFDTICNATNERQEEAERLAEVSDCMIVIGGRESSNTTKLYEICKACCKNTFHIETADELPLENLTNFKRIGVTAGASTPDDIIKEVLQTMSENLQENDTAEISFEDALEQSLKPLNNGDIVKGIITAIAPNEITVDLGTKQAGYIAVSEFSSDPNVKIEDSIKVGDEIEVQVVRLSDVDGTVMLSKKRLESVKAFAKVSEAVDTGEILDAFITEVVNAGVIANHKGVNIFIPASQSGVPKEGDLNTLLKKAVKIKIIDVQLRGRRKKIVGSIRGAQKELRSANEEKVFSDIEVGKKYTGTVKSFTSFGAFVDIGGVDGMIHISEMSWSRIKHPSEVFNIGDKVEVYIKEFDAEKKRISLGYRNPEENPSEIFKAQFHVDDIVDVTIVRIVPFGAFAEIVPGVDGLIHISQISNVRVNKIHDFLEIGQVVKAKIISIDEDATKVSLSIRALIPEEEVIAVEESDTADSVVYSDEAAPTEEADSKAEETTETVTE